MAAGSIAPLKITLVVIHEGRPREGGGIIAGPMSSCAEQLLHGHMNDLKEGRTVVSQPQRVGRSS
jgi:hypothetical protein